MKEITGDLIKLAKEGKFTLIIHGCNCFHTMGSGIAKQVKEQFPEAYDADLLTPYGDINKLGTCSFTKVPLLGDSLIVVNAYIQHHYGKKVVNVHYESLRKCMRWVKNNFPNENIGIPLIGAGLAGGRWATIEGIIDAELIRENVTLVRWDRA